MLKAVIDNLLPSAFGAGVGLTMSEEGGLDEVEEVLRAAASCARSAAISAVEFAEVRDAIARAFNAYEFDMFLYERLDFDRPANVAEGPFKLVVTNVLKQAGQQGWDPLLIAEVAAVRPLKSDVQVVYHKYAMALIDESRRQAVNAQQLAAMERFGLSSRVDLQKEGSSQLPAPASATSEGFEKRVKRYLPDLNVGLWREQLFRLEGRVCRVEVNGDPQGTGFLVGPDKVLTCYHVLENAIVTKLSGNKVKCRGARSSAVALRDFVLASYTEEQFGVMLFAALNGYDYLGHQEGSDYEIRAFNVILKLAHTIGPPAFFAVARRALAERVRRDDLHELRQVLETALPQEAIAPQGGAVPALPPPANTAAPLPPELGDVLTLYEQQPAAKDTLAGQMRDLLREVRYRELDLPNRLHLSELEARRLAAILAAILALESEPDPKYLRWLSERVTVESPVVGFLAAKALIVAARRLGRDLLPQVRAEAEGLRAGWTR